MVNLHWLGSQFGWAGLVGFVVRRNERPCARGIGRVFRRAVISTLLQPRPSESSAPAAGLAVLTPGLPGRQLKQLDRKIERWRLNTFPDLLDGNGGEAPVSALQIGDVDRLGRYFVVKDFGPAGIANFQNTNPDVVLPIGRVEDQHPLADVPPRCLLQVFVALGGRVHRRSDHFLEFDLDSDPVAVIIPGRSSAAPLEEFHLGESSRGTAMAIADIGPCPEPWPADEVGSHLHMSNRLGAGVLEGHLGGILSRWLAGTRRGLRQAPWRREGPVYTSSWHVTGRARDRAAPDRACSADPERRRWRSITGLD